ncbi:N-acetylglucosamine-6-phosphate deacetylase, partial [Francisella tularensis subsp. holarctica]|nr:N-acetylglucosamine-6-phosphate deacetylase [Francisella tularensis subsp. holarctica]
IDIHIHGSKGADVMDGDVDALAVLSKSLYTQGVTSYLATTMTAANEQILKSMRAIKDYNSQTHLDSAKIVGVHQEGPF